jgi:hypothetical protein
VRLPAGNSASAGTITNLNCGFISTRCVTLEPTFQNIVLSISTSTRLLLNIFFHFQDLGLFLFCLESSLIPLQIPEASSCFVHLLGHAKQGMGFLRHRSAGKRCISCKQGYFQRQVCQSVVLATRSPLDPRSACTLLTYAYCRNNLYMLPVRQTSYSMGCSVHIPQMLRVGLGRHHFNALVTSYSMRVSSSSHLASNGKSSEQETGGNNFFVIGENALIIFDRTHS